jgi:hypothetical protein
MREVGQAPESEDLYSVFYAEAITSPGNLVEVDQRCDWPKMNDTTYLSLRAAT